jgi:hypothetical protein
MLHKSTVSDPVVIGCNIAEIRVHVAQKTSLPDNSYIPMGTNNAINIGLGWGWSGWFL